MRSFNLLEKKKTYLSKKYKKRKFKKSEIKKAVLYAFAGSLSINGFVLSKYGFTFCGLLRSNSISE